MFEILNQALLSPLLSTLHLRTPPDRTWGRYLLPENSSWSFGQEGNSDFKVQKRRVFIGKNGRMEEGEEVEISAFEVKSAKGREWMYYEIWTSVEGLENGPASGCDLVVCHGMGDYGWKFAPHMGTLLASGFRVIVPDLPSHGRSTGVHVHFDSADELPDRVHVVVQDVARWCPTPPRKRFLHGFSIGGYIALSYCLRHATHTQIDGVYAASPLIGVAPETDEPEIVKIFGRLVRPILGRIPLIPSLSDGFSDDPRVIKEYFADPRTYHGNLRIATGLALLEGLSAMVTLAPEFVIPIRMAHGNHDRMTSHTESQNFIARAGSTDKSIEIYEGIEHSIYKIGIDDEDDKPRQRALKDRDEWLLARV